MWFKTLGAIVLIIWTFRTVGSRAGSLKAPPLLGNIGGAESVYIPETLTWDDWLMVYEKKYDEGEHDSKRETYLANIKGIEEHNKRYDMGLETSRLGVNQFAALTTDEYIDRYTGTHNLKAPKQYADHSLSSSAVPSSLDWRELGVVTEIKNQGLCGSCWSFSTTGAIEGHWAIKTGNLISLSEQQLMDCSRAYGDMSCSGGLMDNAYEYVVDNEGLDSEDDYPYQMKDEPCETDHEKLHVAMISGYNDVESGDKELEAAISMGPVSVGIIAGQLAFQLYRSGVYRGAQCGTGNLNHGVLAVGYTPEYWIVKNSWGATWGDQGYIHMARGAKYGDNGVCGILLQASYPVISPKPHPKPRPTPPNPDPDMEYYENPWKAGGCHSGEQAVQVQNVGGAYCAPMCQGMKCPATPAGYSARAMCALQAPSGDKYCGLICKPTDPNACNPKAGSTCKKIQTGVGLCTYDESRSPTLQIIQNDLIEIVELTSEYAVEEGLKDIIIDMVEAMWA